MNIDNLQQRITHKFGVTATEADRLIREQQGRSNLRSAIASATQRRTHAAPDADFAEDPQAWRSEVQKRMQAIEIMEEGVKSIKDLQKLLKRIEGAEAKLIGKKTASVNKKDGDWWDMQHSGWAMGGRDMFAQKLCDIVRGLGEERLAAVIMDKIGFKRTIPVDEDDIAPLVPMDIQPGQQVPAYEQDEPAPKDAEDVEAMLVAGARRK